MGNNAGEPQGGNENQLKPPLEKVVPARESRRKGTLKIAASTILIGKNLPNWSLINKAARSGVGVGEMQILSWVLHRTAQSCSPLARSNFQLNENKEWKRNCAKCNDHSKSPRDLFMVHCWLPPRGKMLGAGCWERVRCGFRVRLCLYLSAIKICIKCKWGMPN